MISIWLWWKSTGNESRLVVWPSHWDCWINAGCWRVWEGTFRKGSAGTWEAASRAEFATNRHFLSYKHYKSHLIDKKNWSSKCEGLGFIHSDRWGRVEAEFLDFVQITDGHSDAQACHIHFSSSRMYMWPYA